MTALVVRSLNCSHYVSGVWVGGENWRWHVCVTPSRYKGRQGRQCRDRLDRYRSRNFIQFAPCRLTYNRGCKAEIYTGLPLSARPIAIRTRPKFILPRPRWQRKRPPVRTRGCLTRASTSPVWISGPPVQRPMTLKHWHGPLLISRPPCSLLSGHFCDSRGLFISLRPARYLQPTKIRNKCPDTLPDRCHIFNAQDP